MKYRLIKRRLWYGIMGFLSAMCIVGCNVKITQEKRIPLVTDVSIPAISSDMNNYDNHTITSVVGEYGKVASTTRNYEGTLLFLGENCALSDLLRNNEIILEVLRRLDFLPDFILRFAAKMKIQSIVIEDIELVARTGNFSSMDSVELDMRSPTDGSVLFSFYGDGPFYTTVQMQPTGDNDVWATLNGSGIECVENYAVFSGEPPVEEIIYDAFMNVTIRMKIRLI